MSKRVPALRLWADYQEFVSRDLCEYDITYLFA